MKSQIATSSPQGMRSQIATTSVHGGRRELPFASTEHGAIMAANVLNSPQAATKKNMLGQEHHSLNERTEVLCVWTRRELAVNNPHAMLIKTFLLFI